MAVDLPSLTADLLAETDVTIRMLEPLSAADWDRPTPSPGWTIRDQVTHLAYFDDTAAMAVTDPARFRVEADELMALGDHFPDHVAARFRHLPGSETLDWFRAARTRLLATVAGADPRLRLPWYGPPMSLASAVTARLMETWAHGQDIADAVGVTREPTARLRHVAHLGVGTFGFTHALHGVDTPTAPVRVDLRAPDGDRWTWGPPDAADRVTGTALDFCLVVTQRRHLDDTALQVTGRTARAWLVIAQAYAGRAGEGRAPGRPDPTNGARS
jgi:uncharacterized protein (TIGR03084 family)